MCNVTLSFSFFLSLLHIHTHIHTHTYTHTQKEVFLQSNVTDPKEYAELSFHLTMTAESFPNAFLIKYEI